MFARIAKRTGVQLPSPPAFAFGATRKSEGCHAGAKRRRAILNFLSAFQKTTAWQASQMQRFFYVYVLVSEDNETIHYTGITQDVQARLIRHNQGLCAPTAKYRPWRIQTAIAFDSEIKARAFERYLKTGSGREFARRHF
jgi:putative endonuclease